MIVYQPWEISVESEKVMVLLGIAMKIELGMKGVGLDIRGAWRIGMEEGG